MSIAVEPDMVDGLTVKLKIDGGCEASISGVSTVLPPHPAVRIQITPTAARAAKRLSMLTSDELLFRLT